MLSSLLVSTVPDWISNSFPIIRIIICVLLVLSAIALIILVFMQINGGSNASNALTGNIDSYYAKNKSSSREGMITKAIYIVVAIIAVLCILFYLSYIPYQG